VTAGESTGEVLEVVVVPAGVPELGENADGERVAADAGEVFAQQAGRSLGVAGGGAADHLDVVAFPAHLPAIGTCARRSGDGAQIGDGQSEGRVGVDCEAQCRRRLACTGGSLGLAVERGRPPVCCENPAVVLDWWSGLAQAIIIAGGLAGRWLHGYQVGRVA
jgi:hypothetical protein